MLQLRNTGMSSPAQIQNVICIERMLGGKYRKQASKGEDPPKGKGGFKPEVRGHTELSEAKRRVSTQLAASTLARHCPIQPVRMFSGYTRTNKDLG